MTVIREGTVCGGNTASSLQLLHCWRDVARASGAPAACGARPCALPRPPGPAGSQAPGKCVLKAAAASSIRTEREAEPERSSWPVVRCGKEVCGGELPDAAGLVTASASAWVLKKALPDSGEVVLSSTQVCVKLEYVFLCLCVFCQHTCVCVCDCTAPSLTLLYEFLLTVKMLFHEIIKWSRLELFHFLSFFFFLNSSLGNEGNYNLMFTPK